MMGLSAFLPHHPSVSTLPDGRLLKGQ